VLPLSKACTVKALQTIHTLWVLYPSYSKGISVIIEMQVYCCWLYLPGPFENTQKYIHTYRSRFIPERLAEASQIFLRDAHVLPKLLSYEEYCSLDSW
jgi:hypothetical protein